jgi:hypothetical protein
MFFLVRIVTMYSALHSISALVLIGQTVFDLEYKSWSYSLCSFLQLSVTSSILGSNTFNTLFLNCVYICSPINLEAKFGTRNSLFTNPLIRRY